MSIKSKSTWAFRLADGMRRVVFRRRAADSVSTPTYAVQRGDMFYNGVGGAGRWGPQIKGDDATLAIQVASAMPGPDGRVEFVLYRIRDGVFVRVCKYASTQRKFLKRLRDGVADLLNAAGGT